MGFVRSSWRYLYSDHPEDFDFHGNPLPPHVIEKRRRQEREDELVSLVETHVAGDVEAHVDRIREELPALVEAIINDQLAKRNGQWTTRP